MFLAHFSGWSHGELMELGSRDIKYWFNEALSLHKRLNSTKDE